MINGTLVASEDILLVMIVREVGLRSSLVARLGMSGADLLTADDFDDPRIGRGRRGPLVLIADQEALDGYAGGGTALADDPRWHRIVIIAPGAEAEYVAGMTHLPRAGAAAAIVALLPEWQDD